MKKDIIVGVTSGIALYKAVDLVKLLKKKANVTVIMTEHATKLIDPKEFEKASKNKVAVKLFKKNFDYADYIKNKKYIKHISLSDKADLIVIAPATANVIAKLANGVADDLLTTTVLATQADVVVCPSMNVHMWQNKVTKENVGKLKKIGFHIIEPEYGNLACGYKGKGRLPKIEKIEGFIVSLINKKNQLKNKKIIVTAGGTVEPIDDVRVITNRSSGKMGIYIAEEAHRRGAKVTLIRGNTSVEPAYGFFKDLRIESVNGLSSMIKKNAKNNDIIIHAAAVSDFAVGRSKGKIKSNKKPNIELKPTIKIINNIKKLNKKIKLVGFKAESKVSKRQLIDRAYKKLKESDADLMVANDVGRNKVFGSENNDVLIVDKKKKVMNIKGSKRVIASKIIDLIK
ncbi:bifunctional phosphopantothenoylcysteine decarboxylase/phosphopantothenate--cysteine ligase CoaBC [Candidatus Woesearchaeota archaeon]|nr:bifunctional phosphopantothenoylcysteine decarboxylase/phosphopantothenate--cysteine ligase CoaBC [Candidatus Woesearchaeota archaeon]